MSVQYICSFVYVCFLSFHCFCITLLLPAGELKIDVQNITFLGCCKRIERTEREKEREDI